VFLEGNFLVYCENFLKLASGDYITLLAFGGGFEPLLSLLFLVFMEFLGL